MTPLRAIGSILAWGWRELLRALVLLDIGCHLLVQRVVRPQHALMGRCLRRGMCCRHIVGDPPGAMRRRDWAMRLFAAYHRVMHRFQVVARTAEGALIFRCGHLTSAGTCGIYRYRPRLCRLYPVLPFFGPPRLLPGCGYRTGRREVVAMRPRRSLPIVGAHVAVHHPDPDRRGSQDDVERPEDFHLVQPFWQQSPKQQTDAPVPGQGSNAGKRG